LLALLFRHHLQLVDAGGGPVPPARVLERVNAGLRTGSVVPGLFVTAVVALHDLRRGEIAIASAGHPPVLWLHADGRAEALNATGPALGLLDHADFGTLQRQLRAEDRLLFYTDGLAELHGPSPATVDELGALLRRIGRRADALELLCQELAAGTPPRERDDVTALLLDLGSGESCCLEPEAETAATAPVAGPVPVIRCGESVDAAFLVLGGRVTWQYADTLLGTALAVLDARRRLVIDLADCEHLDSTVLGTLHELAVRADGLGVPLALQRVPERVAAAFAELSLVTVQRHVGATAADLPTELVEMEVTPRDSSAQRERLLQAHRTLASLSERNRELFAGVIDALKDG
jgi:anti-anti-sigma regulatory factor